MKDLSRLKGAVDLELMANQKIVAVGVGGALTLYENLVRSGLGELVVIDYDKLDESNITTQGAYSDEVGMLKVEALSKRLKRINPNLKFTAISGDFLEISDEELKNICSDANLLMLMTDSFHAQAKGNRVAIQYKIPAIFAMMFEKARCSEIFFFIPNVTPACFRCAVSARYKAYDEGYINDITSVGSTIMHTYYLNSMLGLVSLAILHNSTKGTELSNWFGSYWHKNYIQLKTHPDYGLDRSGSLFDRLSSSIGKYSFNFHTAWQTIAPERPPEYDYYCPDCGGKAEFKSKTECYEQAK